MENILHDLKRAGIVRTSRGASGGYRLAAPAEEITLAEVIRAVEGPLANVRGEWLEAVEYPGAAEPLQEVWIAVRANLRAVLESVTLADLAEATSPTRDHPYPRPQSLGAPLRSTPLGSLSAAFPFHPPLGAPCQHAALLSRRFQYRRLPRL